MIKINEYLTIKQAAKELGITANTLRNWEKAGKIKVRRHPINKYRLYLREELEAILKSFKDSL